MTAAFLIAFGCGQALAALTGLRGLSLTANHRAAGAVLGAGLVALGGTLIARGDQPTIGAVLAAVPLAVVALAAGGVISNWRHDPSRDLFAPSDSAAFTAAAVRIPVALPDRPPAPAVVSRVSPRRVRKNAAGPAWLSETHPDDGPDAMPATLFRPHDWGGPAVLLICGAGDNRFAFKWRLIRALLERRLAVLTIDPPGHGAFMRAPMTVGNAKACARAALDWLHNEARATAVGGLGISFGGCQLAWLGSADERLRAMALVSTPCELPAVTRATIAREAAWLALPRNVSLLRDGSLWTLWREWQRLAGAWYGENLYSMIRAFGTDACVRNCGGRPLLLVHGARDAAVPAANARRLCAAAGDEGALVMAAQATHLSLILYPREMDDLARWMAEALARLRPAGA